MKKLISALSIGTYFALASSAFAQHVETCPTDTFAGLCNLDFSNLVPVLINTLFIIAIVVALFYLIWGGFKWLTSGGDKGGVQAAREHIIAAVIGLVVIFLSYFILNIFIRLFLHTTINGGFDLPTLP